MGLGRVWFSCWFLKRAFLCFCYVYLLGEQEKKKKERNLNQGVGRRFK